MPTYDVTNVTDDDIAYVRVYNPAEYLIRTKMHDPYYFSFTVAAQTNTGYSNNAHEMVFKVKLLTRPRLRSGNITFSKRNRYDDQQWQDLVIGVKVTTNTAGDTVSVLA
jgi:hypothetical protein